MVQGATQEGSEEAVSLDQSSTSLHPVRSSTNRGIRGSEAGFVRDARGEGCRSGSSWTTRPVRGVLASAGCLDRAGFDLF